MIDTVCMVIQRTTFSQGVNSYWIVVNFWLELHLKIELVIIMLARATRSYGGLYQRGSLATVGRRWWCYICKCKCHLARRHLQTKKFSPLWCVSTSACIESVVERTCLKEQRLKTSVSRGLARAESIVV